jgi:ubiquinone/menaquinone biosynthesis C-methylase UbiE
MLPLSRQNAYRERYKRQHPNWRTSGEVFEALTRHYMMPTSRVLDLGCGRGGVMELFWRDVRLSVGLDPDRMSLRERRANFPAVNGLGEALPFSDSTFEVVIGMWLLEHLRAPAQVLAEVRRVLKPGGHFIFITPNARHPLVWANRFSWAFPSVQRLLIPKLYGRAQTDTFQVHYQANTLTRLRALAETLDVRVVSLLAVKDPTYLAFNDLFFRLSIGLEALLPKDLGVHLVGDFAKP